MSSEQFFQLLSGALGTFSLIWVMYLRYKLIAMGKDVTALRAQVQAFAEAQKQR